MIAGLRLRAGRGGPTSAKGAARMVAQAIGAADAIGADAAILVRGDSAFSSARRMVGACRSNTARGSSVAMARTPCSRAFRVSVWG